MDHGHLKTTTFLAALRSSGTTPPRVIDGAFNGWRFLAYVRQQLAPKLCQGDLVPRLHYCQFRILHLNRQPFGFDEQGYTDEA